MKPVQDYLSEPHAVASDWRMAAAGSQLSCTNHQLKLELAQQTNLHAERLLDIR